MRRRPGPGSGPGPRAPVGAPFERDVLIERVGAQGDGVAAGGLFVPLTLPGERVQVRGAGDRAEVCSLLSPSQDRVEAPCPHFGRCGGCALQHWSRAPYGTWKQDLVRSLLTREGLEAAMVRPFQAEPGERRRLALHARRRPAGGALLGFKQRRSWTLTPIEACVVADKRLVAAFPALERLAAPLLEHPKSAPILHATLTETGLAVEVSGVEGSGAGLTADSRVRLAEIAAEADLAQVTLGGDMIYQSRAPLVRFGAAAVVLPPGGFLQAVARAEAAMAAEACRALEGHARVADLFCGSGAFTLRLARIASVRGLDADAAAVGALLGGRAQAQGLKAVDAEVRDLFRRPLLAGEMKGLDGVVLDPPRAGALDQVKELARSGVSTVVSMSCNPATFARDAAVLVSGGFRLEEVVPVDQFLWSPHMELVGIFRR